MSGIYIHIPFCKQACHYCDFHFSTSLKNIERLIHAICLEIELRKDFLTTPPETVYFGGGTPSILDNKHIEKIINTLKKQFDLTPLKEFTFEANPDDINEDKLSFLKDQGVDRLSIGVQSFDEENLKFLNRAHSSSEAHKSIELALKKGFDLSVDLIYGIHTSSTASWELDLKALNNYNINHLSAYCLTIEEKTAFGNWLKSGKINHVEDEKAIHQYELLLSFCERYDFKQYEVSNYARNNNYAIHNSNYWKQLAYLGIGPSAHSYDLNHRYYNISNNSTYSKKVFEGKGFYEKEFLTILNKKNEYLLTSLRTIWGCDLNKLFTELNIEKRDSFLFYIQELINNDLLKERENFIFLTPKGFLLADSIIEKLFF